ncbi:hypothetical protein ACSF86_08880 [Moraxella bovoculi]
MTYIKFDLWDLPTLMVLPTRFSPNYFEFCRIWAQKNPVGMWYE